MPINGLDGGTNPKLAKLYATLDPVKLQKQMNMQLRISPILP